MQIFLNQDPFFWLNCNIQNPPNIFLFSNICCIFIQYVNEKKLTGRKFSVLNNLIFHSKIQ